MKPKGKKPWNFQPWIKGSKGTLTKNANEMTPQQQTIWQKELTLDDSKFKKDKAPSKNGRHDDQYQNLAIFTVPGYLAMDFFDPSNKPFIHQIFLSNN